MITITIFRNSKGIYTIRVINPDGDDYNCQVDTDSKLANKLEILIAEYKKFPLLFSVCINDVITHS